MGESCAAKGHYNFWMAKRFDRNFKVTGQQDARGYLYIFAGVPLDNSIEVTPLHKDLSIPGFLVDDC